MKSLIWIGFFIGSTLGGLFPMLWGANPLGLQSVFFSAAGALVGIWLGYKIGQEYF